MATDDSVVSNGRIVLMADSDMIQIPLGLRLPVSATFANFEVGDNVELVSALQRNEGRESIYLWGLPGSGRSHLLQAASRAGSAAGLAVFYLPFSEAGRELAPAMLEGMARFERVCIDDIDLIAGDRNWEEALFELYNELRERGGQLLVSAGTPPSKLPLVLPDLRSRLGWGLTYRLQALDEAGRIRVLKRRATERGLLLGDEVVAYLMRRWQRDLGSLLTLLDHLDQASLVAKRPLTVPFVRDCLARLEEDESR